MIPDFNNLVTNDRGKPRASGDDPNSNKCSVSKGR